MARVVWPRQATDDIDDIVAYIAESDPIAAEDINGRFILLGDSLKDFPNRGRPAAGGFREMVNVHPYIMRYWTDGLHVVIVSVRHGARNPDQIP